MVQKFGIRLRNFIKINDGDQRNRKEKEIRIVNQPVS